MDINNQIFIDFNLEIKAHKRKFNLNFIIEILFVQVFYMIDEFFICRNSVILRFSKRLLF